MACWKVSLWNRRKLMCLPLILRLRRRPTALTTTTMTLTMMMTMMMTMTRPSMLLGRNRLRLPSFLLLFRLLPRWLPLLLPPLLLLLYITRLLLVLLCRLPRCRRSVPMCVCFLHKRSATVCRRTPPTRSLWAMADRCRGATRTLSGCMTCSSTTSRCASYRLCPASR
jgi:hypothetical protein